MESALLSLEDLGASWQLQPIDGATIAKAYYCGEELVTAVPTAIRILYSVDEEAFVLHAIAVYESETAARETMAAERRATENCTAVVSTDGVDSTTYEIEAVSFPTFGDESNTFKSIEVDEDLAEPDGGYDASIRYGRNVMLLSVSGLPGTIDEERAIAIFESADQKFGDHIANSAD